MSSKTIFYGSLETQRWKWTKQTIKALNFSLSNQTKRSHQGKGFSSQIICLSLLAIFGLEEQVQKVFIVSTDKYQWALILSFTQKSHADSFVSCIIFFVYRLAGLLSS